MYRTSEHPLSITQTGDAKCLHSKAFHVRLEAAKPQTSNLGSAAALLDAAGVRLKGHDLTQSISQPWRNTFDETNPDNQLIW